MQEQLNQQHKRPEPHDSLRNSRADCRNTTIRGTLLLILHQQLRRFAETGSEDLNENDGFEGLSERQRWKHVPVSSMTEQLRVKSCRQHPPQKWSSLQSR